MEKDEITEKPIVVQCHSNKIWWAAGLEALYLLSHTTTWLLHFSHGSERTEEEAFKFKCSLLPAARRRRAQSDCRPVGHRIDALTRMEEDEKRPSILVDNWVDKPGGRCIGSEATIYGAFQRTTHHLQKYGAPFAISQECWARLWAVWKIPRAFKLLSLHSDTAELQ